MITGEVETEQRRRQVGRWAAEALPGPIRNEVSVRTVENDPQVEVVS